MKKILFFLTFTPFSLFSQIGVGVFKINQTKIGIIDSITETTELNKQISYINNRTWERYNKDVASTRGIIELKIDTADYGKSDDHAFIDSTARVFYINYFKIGQLPVFNIYLVFYRDTLIHFSCESSFDFNKVFTLKYGEPKYTTEKKNITCQNGYGATYNYEDVVISSHWFNLSKNIIANDYYSRKYDQKCEPFTYKSFSLWDDVKYKPIESKEKVYRDTYDKKIKDEEEKKLIKGF